MSELFEKSIRTLELPAVLELLAAQADLNLELCTLAQAVTVSDTDVDTAIANFEKTASGMVG